MYFQWQGMYNPNSTSVLVTYPLKVNKLFLILATNTTTKGRKDTEGWDFCTGIEMGIPNIDNSKQCWISIGRNNRLADYIILCL